MHRLRRAVSPPQMSDHQSIAKTTRHEALLPSWTHRRIRVYFIGFPFSTVSKSAQLASNEFRFTRVLGDSAGEFHVSISASRLVLFSYEANGSYIHL